MTVMTCIMLQEFSISNKCCPFELSMQKKCIILSSTTVFNIGCSTTTSILEWFLKDHVKLNSKHWSNGCWILRPLMAVSECGINNTTFYIVTSIITAFNFVQISFISTPNGYTIWQPVKKSYLYKRIKRLL